MRDIDCKTFQDKVDELLVRHRSILDVLSKFQESNARVNRSVVKAVTNCGCINITASKKDLPPDIDLEQMKNFMETHLQGKLCDSCKEIIEMELGNNLFYLVSLCNLLNLDLSEILKKEYGKISILGKFNLS
ncbi:hypothetical protein SAMN02745227_01907 [Anaerobranca californiensis DSM 14826]|uniref:DUF1573 domain-containing protein n=1 Tax=Anaerobranca californiensis DSM 14826 TaxID=1120989 RepID=A0A1M6QZT0_9FIRM|nr:DUF1573 domain-containing protein [Anaerobranca californiensis]SHK25567.1 hypothetical protein SAMN02745227_01907 [Anaerobranca californiensis DSM 14826]